MSNLTPTTKEKIATVAVNFTKFKPLLSGLNVNANKQHVAKQILAGSIFDVICELPYESHELIDASAITISTNAKTGYTLLKLVHPTSSRSYSFNLMNMEELFNA